MVIPSRAVGDAKHPVLVIYTIMEISHSDSVPYNQWYTGYKLKHCFVVRRLYEVVEH